MEFSSRGKKDHYLVPKGNYYKRLPRTITTTCLKAKKHRQSSDYQCFFHQSGWLDSNQRPHAPQTIKKITSIILIIKSMPICPFLSVCTMVCTVQIGLVNIEFTITKIIITSVILNFIIAKLVLVPNLFLRFKLPYILVYCSFPIAQNSEIFLSLLLIYQVSFKSFVLLLPTEYPCIYV